MNLPQHSVHPSTPVALVVAALLATGCGRSDSTWRSYDEIHVEESAPRAPSARPPGPSAAASPRALAWTAPAGWTEEAGSGMRLATFTLHRDEQTGTCTIVTLGGAAGGLEANVRRWLGQLQLATPPAEAFASFLERQVPLRTEGGFEGTLVDLTELGDPAPTTPSMLAALLPVDDLTLFVKLTGPRGLLLAEKEAFAQLCRSVRNRTE